MELIATPRPPDTDHGNLFVRLSPRTALQLYELSLPLDNGPDGASMSSLITCDAVEFLPLEITFRTKNGAENHVITVYGSYNGGAPAPFSLVSTPYKSGEPLTETRFLTEIDWIVSVLWMSITGYEYSIFLAECSLMSRDCSVLMNRMLPSY